MGYFSNYDSYYTDREDYKSDKKIITPKFDDVEEELRSDERYESEHDIKENYNVQSPANDLGLSAPKYIIMHWVEPIEERRYLTKDMQSSHDKSKAKVFTSKSDADIFLNVYNKKYPRYSGYWKVMRLEDNNDDLLSRAINSMSC